MFSISYFNHLELRECGKSFARLRWWKVIIKLWNDGNNAATIIRPPLQIALL